MKRPLFSQKLRMHISQGEHICQGVHRNKFTPSTSEANDDALILAEVAKPSGQHSETRKKLGY